MEEGELVSTDIDAFLKYLNENEETEAGELARKLEIDEKSVDEWAKVLEASGNVKITYRMGKMYVAAVSHSIK